MLRLGELLQIIQETGVLTIDLTWLNNNYQRSLTRYARRCSADHLRALKEELRLAVMTCLVWQVYRDVIDHMIDMHDKLMLRVLTRAQEDIDAPTTPNRARWKIKTQKLAPIGSGRPGHDQQRPHDRGYTPSAAAAVGSRPSSRHRAHAANRCPAPAAARRYR